MAEKSLCASRAPAELTVVAELGELSRFARAKQLMAYGGIVPSEDSSGERTRRGNITKTGNAHLRRVVVEAAWAYRHRPFVGATLRKRQEHVSEEVKEISWKAQQRLHERYRKLLAKGKNKGVVVTAVGRRVAGFYLGHRDPSRNSAEGVSAAGGITGICSEVRSSREAAWVAVEGYTERRILEGSMR
jgi:hypothetical protein